MCFYYNPELTYHYFSRINFTFDIFITILFKHLDKIGEDYEKIRIFIGLTNILKLNPLPVTVNNHLSSFLNRIVDMTTKILDLRHKDNESSEMDDNENKIAESEDEEDEVFL
jgi:hypothetical protein